VYVTAENLPNVRRGLGLAIISTSKGLLPDREARKLGVGGEVICEVW
jgi:small subunit ribosomal protein S8